MILSKLQTKLIELGLPTEIAMQTEMAHHRHIRSTVENNPTLKRIASFMEETREDLCDEHGDEVGNHMINLSIAHGAIMHFSKAKLAIPNEGKLKERIGKDSLIQEIVTEFQVSSFRPEYDALAFEEEYFNL